MLLNRKQIRCAKCGMLWGEVKKASPPVVLISLENHQVRYISCEDKFEIAVCPKKRYNTIKYCPDCEKALWDYQDGIPNSLKHLRTRLRNESRMILNFKDFVYTRLLAGNEVPMDLKQNLLLSFTIFGDFILENKEKETKQIIPQLQAISRISKFVSDLEKEDLLTIVASKLTWFSNLHFEEDKRNI